MPYTDQSLVCPRGDSLTFNITMDAGDDLTGATAVEWVLAEGDFDGAQIFLTKTLGAGIGIFQTGSQWTVAVMLSPTETKSVASGLLYHECKVMLPDGTVSHVTSGPFTLAATANP